MDNAVLPASEDIRLTIEPFSSKHMAHNYFNKVRLLTDSVMGYCQVKGSEAHYALLPNELIEIPDSTVQCKIHLQGKGRVYGLSMETAVGVIVDNIPMRGSSGSFFNKIDSASLSDFYRDTNTRLIILQFGGNMIPHTKNPSTLNGYVKTLQKQVRYLRQCAPQAAILFVGPSDMSTRVDGKLTTYPLLPYLDKRLALMAQEEKIAYWSLYNAMGGFESMITWHNRGLAGGDYVHFTRSGANTAGRMLGKWIDEGKEL
jgi:lysophospholipase L1-like esterase